MKTNTQLEERFKRNSCNYIIEDFYNVKEAKHICYLTLKFKCGRCLQTIIPKEFYDAINKETK